MITLALTSLFLIAPTPPTCDREIEIYGSTWEISACVNNDDDLRNLLRRVPEEALFDVEWCVIEDDWVVCDEITRNTAHKWCSMNEKHPQYCDGVCCVMTIIDCGCGGCISGTTWFCD